MQKDVKQYKILVTEDNAGDMGLITDYLHEQMANCELTIASTYKQSAKILSEPGIVFDAILLDLTLSDKSGQDLITEMLLVAGLCPIIVLTGNQDLEFSIRSISAGVFDYLIKDDLIASTLYKSIIYTIERKKIISELKASEKRYSDLFRLSPQPMWVSELETGRFVHVNKATTELYGYTEEEFKHLTELDIHQKDKTGDTPENNAPQLEEDAIHDNKVYFRKKTKQIVVANIYSTPITINDKLFRSVIAIDVTEKTEYEHKLVQAIIKTQEDERYEIGGELHDNVCQILAATRLSLGMMKDLLPMEGAIWFDQCKSYLSLATEEIRNLSHRLAPSFFKGSTLEEKFRTLLGEFNVEGKYDVSIFFNNAVEVSSVSTEMQLNLYRILQEELNNIFKYAKASSIEVHVFVEKDKIAMSISDNGIGFDMSAVKSGIGLANMKRRAALFSGNLDIKSSPGNGCIVTTHIPLLKAN